MGIDRFILDENNIPRPCEDLYEWAQWIENAHRSGRKNVQQDHVGPYFVSTIFLGLDHSFLTGGPPLLFETMVFRNDDLKGLGDSQDCRRCCTWEEAETQHREALEEVQAIHSLEQS